MQTRHFKRLLPLTAVALLILAFLVIELEGHARWYGAKNKQRITERREPLATHPDQTFSALHRSHGGEPRAIRPKYNNLFWRQPNVWSVGIGLFVDENGDFLEVPDGEGGCKSSGL